MIQFEKMQGLGNDFVVIDAVNQQIKLTQSQIQKLADRHLGVGCDQVLLIEPSRHYDFFYRIYNADGSQAEQCGNGARCIARFIREKNLSDKAKIRVETLAGVIELQVNTDNSVSVNMGKPELNLNQSLSNKQSYDFVSVGNPHAVIQVNDVNDAVLITLAQQVMSSTQFPQGVNVNFVQVLSNTAAKLRVFERGVGETLACGSGACAAAAAVIARGLMDSEIIIKQAGGDLTIVWQGDDLWMRGPAEFVFSGVITI